LYEGTGTYKDRAVASFILLWDPKQGRKVSGTVDFHADIVELISDRPGLRTPLQMNANEGVTYDYSNRLVGLEKGDATKTSFVGSVLTLDWQASNPGDLARVLIDARAVPEPGSILLLAAAVLGLARFTRRRLH
jgi:hypothetical protein